MALSNRKRKQQTIVKYEISDFFRNPIWGSYIDLLFAPYATVFRVD